MAHKDLASSIKRAPADRLVCGLLRFNTNSHLVRPLGLQVVLRALIWSYQEQNANKRLLVAGHTDAVGDAADNLELSTQRALNVLYLLLGDKDRWVQSATASYAKVSSTAAGRGDVRAVLDLAPGLPPVGDSAWSSSDTWGRVYNIYEHRLKRWCGGQGTPPLVEGIYPYTDGTGHLPALEELRAKQKERLLLPADGQGSDAVLGCGEGFLQVNTQSASHENRRIEILWFEDNPHNTENTLLVPWEDPETGEVKRPPIGAPADVKTVAGEVYEPGGWEWHDLGCPDPLIRLPNKSALVIDISGSMTTEVNISGFKTTRLDAAKQMLRGCIQALRDDEYFTAVAFGSGLISLGAFPVLEKPANTNRWQVKTDGDACVFKTPEDAARNQAPLKLQKATDEVQAEAFRWVDGLASWGGTSLSMGLEKAYAVEGIKVVVLLSDGGPSGAVINESAIVARAKTKSGGGTKFRIDAYGFLPPGTNTTSDAACQGFYDWLVTQPVDLKNDVKFNKIKQLFPDSKKSREFNEAWLGWFLKKLCAETGGTFKDLTKALGELRQGTPTGG